GHVFLSWEIQHGKPAAWEEVIPDRCGLGVRHQQRAEEVQGCGTDRHVMAGAVAKQDLLADAKLDIAVRAQIRRVVSSSTNPSQMHRLKCNHRESPSFAVRSASRADGPS